MNKNYIVLNGKHYDAVTGALIKSSNVAPHAKSMHKKPIASTTKPVAPTTKKIGQATLKTSDITPAKPRPDRTHHTATKGTTGRKPAQSKTLMRHAVKKPAKNAAKPTIKQAYPVAKQTTSAVVVPKKSVHSINPATSKRAAATSKSSHINRFGAPVKPIPTHIKPIALQPTPSNTHHESSSPKQQTPAPKASATTAVKKQQMLEKALVNARSHEEPAPEITSKRHGRRRILSSLAVLGAVLVIGSFIAYLNRSSVELQVASVRAGFQASAPSAPSGYQKEATKADSGKVAVRFISPINNDQFTLTQEASSWDSQTLFDSVVASSSTNYQTIQSHGRTIYVYDGDKAAWVDGGILYKVSGSSQLNSDQIVSLATSM